MQAILTTARANGRPFFTQLLIQLLHRLSRLLDAAAAQLAQHQRPASEAPDLEYRRDPRTGHGVLFENGEPRFTFLQGLERL
ncbi:hypothetical protein HNQ51_003682 [Inhella inkyongensis]|uniref:Uncharacterized protein n=1 Tax=Inhella inkyongensis TaxID=392593 RepID=A0A840SBF8_9BURK|nr:hypothetical protein [Inhella inkyongensis]MBB5206336.1 hypothetical protein [Inhella inkyongensis]